MIKCEVIENFTLGDFDKLKNIVRNSNIDKYGELFVRDTFECDENMANYLTGANFKKACVVKVLEVVPEIINKNNIIEKLDEALEKIENEEIVETIPIVDKNNVVVGRIAKEKPKKKKSSKK